MRNKFKKIHSNIIKTTFALIVILFLMNFGIHYSVSAQNISNETELIDRLVPMPKIVTLQPPKDENFNNPETVAGNEQMVKPPSKPTVNNDEPISTAGSQPVIRLASTDEGQIVAEETDNGEVLSTQDAQNENSDQEIEPVTIPESRADEKPPTQAVNNPTVYWWYLLAGGIAFVGLVAFILIASRR